MALHADWDRAEEPLVGKKCHGLQLGNWVLLVVVYGIGRQKAGSVTLRICLHTSKQAKHQSAPKRDMA